LRQAGGVDPVVDETEVKNELASLTEESVKTESGDGAADIKTESTEVKEGDNDPVVTKASEDTSNSQAAGKSRTKYGREVKAPAQLQVPGNP
jgi:hypothetical protein